ATAPARIQVPQALGDTLLPMLCATGRCLLRGSDREATLRPLRWDDAGPWEFWLTVTPGGAGKAYVVAGELRRGEERMALADPLLLLGGVLIDGEDRVAPLPDPAAFPWIELLRKQGEVTVP